MSNLRYFLTDSRTLAVAGAIIAILAVYSVGSAFRVSLPWIAVLVLVIVALCGLVWWVRRRRARRASGELDSMFRGQAEAAVNAAAPVERQDIEQLRARMLDAVKTIKTSKLGQLSGKAALYELPWYVVIGNPAAGKSSAIVNSGLNFPFADKGNRVVHGIGGTRNCDWFFTTEGILLDTAGRYSVQGEDRAEWLGFLDLLKRHRPRSPINGIMIVASIAELTRNRPDHTIELAKKLRQRVQELTERLEIFAPVYVVFTKVDLVAGFGEFFADIDPAERDRVWGATLPYDIEGKTNAVTIFEEHFDRLFEGLQEMSTNRMSQARGQRQSLGLLTFPLEFAGLEPHLHSFIATLFEDNPFQFKPIFRGFYFTSALQEGTAEHATGRRIIRQFGLSTEGNEPQAFGSSTGFFLKNLFSGVIFPDRNLVRQYASRAKLRLRYATFFGTIALLGLLLGAWGWSHSANRQFVANVEADLQKAVRVQDGKIDLASRLEALEILQDRIEQLEHYHKDKPLALGFGLYQGERIESRLRSEYFRGLQQVMLGPVSGALEGFLGEVNAHADKLLPMVRPPEFAGASQTSSSAASATPYRDLSPTNVEDAYNALKTYLMLSSRDHLDPSHLSDQLTRFWRNWLETNRGNMPRERMIRSAEKIISFYISQIGEPDLPLIENRLTLVDASRDSLRPVVKGMAARERVYAEIKMRATTRFPAVTVASIVGEENKGIISGSYAVPGAYTRDAWEQFIDGAFKDAANKELQSADWVLKTTARNDLSLEGSPEQIQKELVRLYKDEYVREWQKFMQGISVEGFTTFDEAAERTRRLSEVSASPLNRVMSAVYRDTSWDNPSLVNEGLGKARRGIMDWFRETILRQTPATLDVNVNIKSSAGEIPMGPVGKEFAAIARLMVARSDNRDQPLFQTYLEQLHKVHSRFAQMKNAGDIGPASRTWLQQTLDGSGSELSDALRLVDETLLAGMSESARSTIRPLLVRPLMQSFAVLIKPSEQDINRSWTAEVYEPFNRALAPKYPFSGESRVEATSVEIAQVFGPDGSIAKFVQTTLGSLATRRGDILVARTWADMGVTLNPAFAANLPRYLAPLGGAAGGGGASAAAGGEPQSTFELQPIPTPGLTEYTIEVDGQALRYRNGPQEWSTFVWPNPRGPAGARITAIGSDGRTLEVANFPGKFGLERFISSAQKQKNGDLFTLTWTNAGTSVSANFRLISNNAPTAPAAGEAQAGGSTAGLRNLRLPTTVVGNGAGA